MRPSRFVILAAMFALLLPGASAAAAPPLVPPGVSGANQYTETLPGPGGNEPTGGGAAHNPKSAAKALGEGNAQRLEALGPEGRAAARLATQGAADGKGNSSPQGHRALNSAGDGSGAAGQVLGNLSGTSDSGGMGALLPLLILAAAVAAVAFLVTRRRSGQTQS
jgi:opacity protein-like surface antigen